jgi:deoxyribodipyrimidine photo-lyase
MEPVNLVFTCDLAQSALDHWQKKSAGLSYTYLNELVWRDFYQMILWHYPRLGEGRAFKPEYEHIKWRNNEIEFESWCKGFTGYPIVDAGMRELNETGFYA